MTVLKLKRAYEPESPEDGFRIYIDKLWPRGLSHETFHYNLWDKDIAPSSELREWFHVDSQDRWPEFEKKYAAELEANPSFSALKQLIYTKPVVTLLFSSHDTERNNAVVVYNLLQKTSTSEP